MADAKISELAAVTDVQGTDEFVLARAGASKKIDASDLATGVVADHTADTTSVHGIADTSVLRPEPQRNRISGRYYGIVLASADGTKVTTKDTVYYLPFPVWSAFSIDRIALGVSGAGGAGSVVRMGLYANSSGVPGALVSDYGTINGESATYQEITISESLSAGTLYWVAVVWQVGTAGVVRAIGSGDGSDWVAMDSNARDPRSSIYVETGVTGALPANATPSVTPQSAAPAVRVRVV